MPPDSVSRYRELLELVRRAMLCGELKIQFGPLDFLHWTRKWKIAINADLASALAEVLHRLIADKPENPRRTDAKIIYALAITHYGFDPRSARNTAAGAIADTCERANLKVSRDTILDRLNEAKELFDLQLPSSDD
jgi:hypothetical protein